MIPIVNSREMREFDRRAIEDIGIPGLILMENAGRGIVDAIKLKYGCVCEKKFLIVCGKGNNGGDGFVVARHLYNLGANVVGILLGSPKNLKGDAEINYKIISHIISQNKSNKNLLLQEYKGLKQLQAFQNVDFIVDAIFGTGFNGKLEKYYEEVINWMNSISPPKISIDVPSGVNSDTGVVESVAVKSDLTVTMGLKKNGLLIGNSVNYINDLKVADISLPKYFYESFPFQTYEVETSDIAQSLPKRLKTVHKYNVGKILVIAGSPGYTGAAALASNSALKTGAGAVALATTPSAYPILAKKLTEVMVHPLSYIESEKITTESYKKLNELIDWADVLIIGCGISLKAEAIELVNKILREVDKPLVLDADALTIISENLSILKKRKSKNVILTPHSGEFARLTKLSPPEIELNKLIIARSFSKEYKLTLILKGAPTITISSNGRVFINSTGNPGMATAGSGDVLAGIIGGLWTQGMDEVEAAYSGVFIHGLSGDFAKQKLGERSVLALDIQKNIHGALKIFESEKQ
ncbi:MAG: NAD(P)H-hydrate dehydratase [Bacteroidota bacterium]|nr:NAD(P)H-hydrate dehydratase [Bacteroidota bacterium]